MLRHATAVCALSVAIVSSTGAVAQPQEPARANLAPDGAFAVVTTPEFLLHDDARDSDLPVIAVHPTLPSDRTTTYPLIVFSHGLGGQGSQVLTLPQHWASHGYIVLVPTYRDSLRHKSGQGRDMGGIRAMLKRVQGPKADFQYRPADVTFLLNSLDAVATHVPALKGRFNRDRIGSGGHSLGAYTTALVGGAKIDLADGTNRASVRDDRVMALLMLSPQGAGNLGLTDGSWDDWHLPVMSVTGSKDGGAGGKSPEWRKEPYLRAPAGAKYHLFVQGAEHSFFTKPPGAKQARQFGKETERAEKRRRPEPAPQRGLLARFLGEPNAKIADMTDDARAKLQRRIERVVELGKGGKRANTEALRAKLQHLLVQLRDGEWEAADVTRDELLRGSSTTSGETIEPLVKFELVKLTTRLFWDAHLKGETNAGLRLTAGDTLEPADGTVTLDAK